MKLFNFFKAPEIATVGRDIKWVEIKKEVLRIIDFDKNGTSVDSTGIVRSRSTLKPYGFLIAEWPIIERKVKIPIVHRDDFLLASSIYDNADLLKQIQGYDILVTYYPPDPKDYPNSAYLHQLHFAITPPTTLEKFYDIKKNTLLGCDPEIIFGDFVWVGELNVKINFEPKLL